MNARSTERYRLASAWRVDPGNEALCIAAKASGKLPKLPRKPWDKQGEARNGRRRTFCG
jgi:hypothetical protein